jgi:hypothetical protein
MKYFISDNIYEITHCNGAAKIKKFWSHVKTEMVKLVSLSPKSPKLYEITELYEIIKLLKPL